MYNIITIPIGKQVSGKITTEMLKATIFDALASNFDLVMKITDVLEKPADFSNGNAWSRTSKFNSFCWSSTALSDSNAICRKFELKPEKKVHCLVFTDRDTDTMIHSLQLLIPVKNDAVVLSEVCGGNMSFLSDEGIDSYLNDHYYREGEQRSTYKSFAEYYANRPEAITVLEGPIIVGCYEPSCFGGAEDEPPIVEGILYVGEGKTMKVYHTCGGTFTDDSTSFFEIYDGETLLHSGVIGNEPFDMDKEGLEDMVENIDKCWAGHKDYMMKHYGIDVGAANVYGVSHM